MHDESPELDRRPGAVDQDAIQGALIGRIRHGVIDEPRRSLAEDLTLELHRQRRQIEQEAV